MSRIANPYFSGTPTDTVTAVDIYSEVDATVRNDFISEVSAFSRTLTDQLETKRGELRGLYAEIETTSGPAREQLQRRADQLAMARDRLNGILSGARQAIKDVSTNFRNRVTDTITAVRNAGESVTLFIDGIAYNLDDATLGTARNVQSMLRDLNNGKTFQLVDSIANTGLLRVMLEEVSTWQIPSLTEYVLDSFGEEERRQAIQLSAPRLANTSDINTLELLVDRGGAPALVANQPNFLNLFLQRYQIPTEDASLNYNDHLSQLVKVMTALSPEWLYVQRGQDQVVNLEVLQSASDDAIRVLSSSPTYAGPALTAQFYPTSDFRSLATEMYPLIALSD